MVLPRPTPETHPGDQRRLTRPPIVRVHSGSADRGLCLVNGAEVCHAASDRVDLRSTHCSRFVILRVIFRIHYVIRPVPDNSAAGRRDPRACDDQKDLLPDGPPTEIVDATSAAGATSANERSSPTPLEETVKEE